MKNKIIIICLFFTSLFTAASQQNNFFKEANSFFNKYVLDAKVDYAAIASNKNELEILLKQIATYQLNSDENADKAFLINAYNVLVISGVVKKYPVNSPMDIAGFFDKIKYDIAGKSLTLNEIENKLIRDKYKDARFHFVLVCGAMGCPPLISKAYFPDTIEKQLDEQTSKALNDPNFLKIYKNKVYLSQIFDWYKADFGKNPIQFINQYRKDKLDENEKYKLYKYNWSLNKK